MGTLNNNPVQSAEEAIFSEQQIQHFSHSHVLQLTVTNQPLNPNTLCFVCELTLSGSAYSCLDCNYFLHLSCAQKPSKIKHPFDLNGHTLNLLATPPYPEGAFRCDGCGKRGTGFCYSCAQCSIDLHVTCASLPLSVTHGSHSHPFDLTFSPPYQHNCFTCYICHVTTTVSYDHWIYRCRSCEFDAHLDCALGKITPRLPAPNHGGCDCWRNQMNKSVNGPANDLMLGLLGGGGLELGGGGDGGGYYDGGYGDQIGSI